MAERIRPPQLPQPLFAAAGYFLPRMLFLPSRHAGQIGWGDIARALHDFPDDCLDLASATFWQRWMERWAALGEDYVRAAAHSSTEPGKRQLYRAAAACFHWAEFMYFSDSAAKQGLRQRGRACWRRSVDPEALRLEEGALDWRGISIPYYLLWPSGQPQSSGAVPCMVMSNGLDSVTEVEMVALAEPYLARGIAVLLFDGPGQGINLGRSPLPLRPEDMVAPLLALLRARPGIDSDRLGFLGISFGGMIALRVAQAYGAQFRCVVNLSGGPQLCDFTLLPRRLKADFACAFLCDDPVRMQSVFDALAVDAGQMPQTELLSVHGARDDIFPAEAVQALDARWGSRHRLMFHPSEAHACLNWIGRISVETADWVAERLHPRARLSLRCRPLETNEKTYGAVMEIDRS